MASRKTSNQQRKRPECHTPDLTITPFKNKYVSLRDQVPALHPDEIFGQLETWAGGTENTTPIHKAAVLAVMAYLFDKCEIFEDAKAVGGI